MPSQSWLNQSQYFTSDLPQYCTPTTPLLAWFSSTTHTCIPTPLAFISTLFGCLSIVAWLCAQLPQLYKNYHLQSTSGLSLFFLVEWCLGDVSNLSGAILTQQATWQILIGAYYCFVDFSLVAQWIWYQKLKHGRPVRRFWKRKHGEHGPPKDGTTQDNKAAGPQTHTRAVEIAGDGKRDKPKPKNIPVRGINFRTPNYGSFQSFKERWSASSSNSSSSPRVHRARQTDQLSSPSPKTVLFITLLIALASASPLQFSDQLTIATFASNEDRNQSISASFTLTELGTILSWFSALLYLFSRLPQLIKNHSRRSTAGLSLALFVAAFFGNFFYSASMLLNPLVWDSYPAYGANGWAGVDGSERRAFVLNALPFFLGSAGVLLMDAAVALQFWWFSSTHADGVVADTDSGEEVLVVDADGNTTKLGKWRWLEVTGYMRGWKPSVSGASITVAPATPEEIERNDSAIGEDSTRNEDEWTTLLAGRR